MIMLVGAVLLALLPMHGMADVKSPQKLPVFMSLRSNKVLMRVGPGKFYPALWEYTVRGLPLEVIGQHNNEWLQVRDSEGETGWIYSRLLSSVRTAMVLHDNVLMHYHPDNNSPVNAKLQKYVVVVPHICRATWCRVQVPYKGKTYKGWIRKQYLWGIVPSEVFEEE